MADIRINAEQWNCVPEEEKNKIIEIYRATGLLEGSDSVIADAGVSLTDEPMPLSYFCRLACDTAATAAAAACGYLAPPAIPACIAGAEIARRACRDEC